MNSVVCVFGTWYRIGAELRRGERVEVWWLLGAEATGVAQRLRRSRLMVARRCIVDTGARKKVMRWGEGGGELGRVQRESGCYILLCGLFVVFLWMYRAMSRTSAMRGTMWEAWIP